MARPGISKSTLIVGTVLWGAVFCSLAFIWQDRQSAVNSAVADEADTDAPEPIRPGDQQSSVKVSFPAKKLPDFEFDEVMGEKLSLKDLEGKRWVASFVFARCTTSCPMISAAVMRLHERVEKDAPEVMFVTFTVDPKYDTVERFREYSETFTKGKRDRWKFVTGGQQQIYELIVGGFGLYVKENLGESRLPGLEVAHTNRVVLVNEKGIPVGTFLGTKEEDMVKLRRILTGRDAFPEAGPGLTFSNADGNPLGIQFEVRPANEATEDESPTEDESADPANENRQTDSAKVEPSDADATSNSKPDDAEDIPLAENDTRSTDGNAVAHNAAIDEKLPEWAKKLPTVNAALNTLSALLLLSGLASIRQQKKERHRNLMIAAFVTSAVFLVCYLVYHYALGRYTGEHGKRFSGEGAAAIVYQLILWPHIFLAVFVPIMALRVFQHAFAERWDAHKQLARITFPIWMFVSVTGVIIYAMLYHWPWPAAAA